jgi:predicted transcriptional regulator YdeE
MGIASILMKFLVHDLSGYEPRIVQLEQPITIIGMSMDTTLKSIYRDVPALARQFEELKRAHPIPNKKEPWAFAAVSKDFDPAAGTQTYIMGDVVTSTEGMLDGLISFEIPALTYAIFPVRPKNRFGWGPAIANTKGYAYTVWMPKSAYQPAGVIDDFEYHDERSTPKRSPEIDLYVAIKKRA